MLPQRVPRRVVRSSVAWRRPASDVCVFCRSACAPNVFQRAYAKYPAPKAPSTRNELWRKRARLVSEKEKKNWADPAAASGKLLPPVAQLQFLKKASLIKAEPENVLRLLDKMRELGPSLDGAKARELCYDHGVALDDMPFVARACLYSRNGGHIQNLGKRVLLVMAANEVPQATLHLLRAAVKQDEGVSSLRKAFDSSELTYARHHLRKLVAQKHPEAMVFHAQRLATAGKRKEAIVLLRDALSSGAADAEDQDDGDSMHKKYAGHFLKDTQVTKGESPWTMLATLEAQEGNFEGAEEAFRSGAFEHDDPIAYQGLAGSEKEHSRMWLEYMTKAAASGAWGAIRKLAHFYTVPLDMIPEKDLRKEMELLEKRGSPVEWWYHYYDDAHLKKIGVPPGTKIIRADFWRKHTESQGENSPDLQMVVLNPREALAMEWYELAFFWSGTVGDNAINSKMQEVVERAALANESKPSEKSIYRRRSMHVTRKSMVFEHLAVMWEEIKGRFRR